MRVLAYSTLIIWMIRVRSFQLRQRQEGRKKQYNVVVQKRIGSRLKCELHENLIKYDRWSLEALADFIPVTATRPSLLEQNAKVANRIKVQVLMKCLTKSRRNSRITALKHPLVGTEN